MAEVFGQRFYAKATNALRSVTAAFNNDVFTKYDVIIMPTVKSTATKLPTAELNLEQFFVEYSELFRTVENEYPYNATGHPAVTVNAGFVDGLPVGLMIVGRHWEDDVILNVAHTLEQQQQQRETSRN